MPQTKLEKAIEHHKVDNAAALMAPEAVPPASAGIYFHASGLFAVERAPAEPLAVRLCPDALRNLGGRHALFDSVR